MTLPTASDPTTPTTPPADAGPTEAAAARPYARPLELAVIAAIVIADQLTKAAIRGALPLGDTRTIVPGLINLTHVQNTGAAFGLLNTAEFPYKPVVMIGIAALALLAIATYASQLGFHERLARLGLALILGGAFGNLIDRAGAGYVIDFVDVYWRDVHFWAFNVADASITVGAVMVLLDMIRPRRRHVSSSI